MAQLLEIDPCHIAFDQLWPTSWFSKGIGGFSKTEQAIELCHDTNGT